MDTSILDKIRLEEKRSRKRMFYYTSIPIIITVVLITFSYNQVNTAGKKVERLNLQNDSLKKEMALKSDSLKRLQEIYEFGVNYKDKRFHLDYSLDKIGFSSYPKQTEMITEIRRLIDSGNVKWKLGGNSINEGFDSPSFASYMVNKYSKTKIPKDKIYTLHNYLEKTTNPITGDLIIYEHGYTMIYFNFGKPFCIGMTPIGLTSLEVNFGPRIIGYYKIDY